MARAVNQAQLDKILAELSSEFIGIATDVLREIEDLARQANSGKIKREDAIGKIGREAHSLKGQGGSFGFGNITLVAHRFEDFLGYPNAADYWDGVVAYVDRMAMILDGEFPREGEVERVLAGLPQAFELDDSVIEHPDIEVLLVVESMTQGHLIRRELEACGFRVTIIANALDALAYAVRVQPRLVLASAMLPVMSGTDLLRALRAMAATGKVACAVLTSMSADDPMLRGIPAEVALIRKGSKFGDDLAMALSKLGIA